MRRSNPVGLIGSVLVLAMTALGCGGGTQDPYPRVGFAGTVTLDGVPLRNGFLYLEPLEKQPTQAFAVIEDGSFEVQPSAGAVPGRYRVAIVRDESFELPEGIDQQTPEGSAMADKFAAPTERKRVMRLAHLTDVHVQPELRAADGLAACLRQVNASEDRPELILTGGDHIMDAFKRPRERAATQWDLWSSVSKNENSIPISSCLGNHDIWGWDNSKSGTKGDEPGYGKKWACDVLDLQKPYYSFGQAGWHFIALDGVQPNPHPGEFSAFLDDAQFDWLSRELASVPKTTPILLWTHIPIVSAVVNHLALRASIHDISTLEAGHVHADSVKLVALFAKHPNIKVCLAGHLHRIEKVEIKGIQYYCNGAVSGKWWKGANDGYPEGYAVVDLYDDGSHDIRYVTYGWKAEPFPTPS